MHPTWTTWLLHQSLPCTYALLAVTSISFIIFYSISLVPAALPVSSFIASTLWSSHLATFRLSLRAPAIRRPARNTRRMRMPSIKITDLCSHQISLLAAFSSLQLLLLLLVQDWSGCRCFFQWPICSETEVDRFVTLQLFVCIYVYCARMYSYYIGCCTIRKFSCMLLS